MEKIIFSKFSNDRDAQFCISTNVIQTSTGRYVRKEACGAPALEHVKKMVINRELLEEKYKDTPIQFAKSELCPEGARIEWVEGNSYAEYLEGLLNEGREEECMDSIAHYFACAFGTGIHDYREDERAISFFGSTVLPSPVKAVSCVDIDMLFSNVIYRQGEWIDYDYEWFVDCDVPVKFLIYRCLLYFLTSSLRMHLVESGIYERFDITKEDKIAFEQMEAHLQQYIEGSTVPMWKLYKKIRGQVIDVRPIVERRLKECWAQVYYDSGSGFSEEESGRMLPEEISKNIFRVRLRRPDGVRVVRYDPAWSSCVLRIRQIEDGRQQQLDYRTNGNALESGCIVFLHDDPQIWIDVSEDVRWIDVEYYLGIIDLDDDLSQKSLLSQYEDGRREIGELSAQLEHVRGEEQKSREEIQALQQKLQIEAEKLDIRGRELQTTQQDLQNVQQNLQNVQQNLHDVQQKLQMMEESLSWKLTQPLRAAKRKLCGNANKEKANGKEHLNNGG